MISSRGTWRALISLLLTCLAAVLFAQQHVRWSIVGDVPKVGKGTVDLHADIDPGWHLYSTVPVKGMGPTPTTIKGSAPWVLTGAVQESEAITKLDPNFQLVVKFFADKADFRVPVKISGPGSGGLSVRFQICDDTTCIPPTTVSVVPGAVTGLESSTPKTGAEDAYSASVAGARSSGLLAFVGLSFVAGLLSLLTPCVFPMIPITVSFFAKRRSAGTSATGVPGALAYCLGIVGSFAIFGMLVSIVFGASGIQRFATNPWINVGLAVLFVVLALSLLGIWNFNLPPALVNRFSNTEGKGGLIAPALMGLTFTLTTFTCTVPFVGTILAGAAQGDYVYPLVGMLSYGTAFALPFFLLALFPQYLSRLPKSGSWLDTVKAFMGFVEIAAALKFLSNADLVLQTGLISRPIFLVCWAIIAGVAGLFLIGVLPLPHHNRPASKSVGRILVGVGSLALALWFVASTGGRSLGELEAFMPPTDHGWIKSYERALALARQTNRSVLINFTGVTCTNCRWMEQNMFPRANVAEALSHLVTAELYTDRETPGDVVNKTLQEKLTGVDTLPEYVVLTPEGRKVRVFQGSTRDVDSFMAFLRG